jgi:hypothetical protein
VAEILKQIALDMRQEDAFKTGMLSDFQFWGVDRVDGTTATLVGQVVCTDSGRWGVQREFNRRIKLAFQQQGIRLMPSASILGFQHPLDVRVELPEMPVHPAEGQPGEANRPGMPPTIDASPAPLDSLRPDAARPDAARPDAARPDAARPRRAGGSGA